MATGPGTVIVGRKRTTPDDFYGDMGASEIRAYVAANAPADAWIRKARFRGGRITGSTPRVRVVVYDTTGAGPAPDDRMYIFPSVYPSDRMDDASDGSLYTVNVDSATKAFLVDGGTNYALAFQVNDASFRHNMVEAADISGENEQFYYKSASSPPDPYGSSTVSTEGWMTLWLEGDENWAPLIPINVSPSGNVFSLTPTIESDFRDPNGTYGKTAYTDGDHDSGDYLQQVQIQVRRKSDGMSFWDNTYTATSGERTANRSSKVYAGTTLVRGTVYQVRVKHWDRKSAASDFSAWVDFTPASLGVVTTTGTPTGKTDDLTPDVQFTWNHASSLSADRAIVKFYEGSIPTPVATSSAVTVSVANGATGTVPWASMGISTPLKDGQLYYYTVEARATDLVYSQPSAKRSFTTDKAPGVPTNLSPPNGAVRSSSVYPVLTAIMADPDDTVATGLTAKVDILNSVGGLIATRVATLRSGTTDTWDYQTTASDLSGVGTYKHRWYGGDGYLWSGAAEVEASATKSAEASFSWAAVPSPVITSPASSATITSEQPTVTWTITNQTLFRVRKLVGGVEAASSGWLNNALARSFTIPLSWLHNGDLFDIEVGVEYLSLQGFATNTNILVAYTPPASLSNFTVLPSVVNFEPQATAAVIRFDNYVGDLFNNFVIWRDDIPDRPWLVSTVLPNTPQVEFTDWHAPSNAVYSAQVTELRGIDEVVFSEPVTAALAMPLRGVVLVGIDNPQTDRYVTLQWDPVDWVNMGDDGEYFTWGADAPINKRGRAAWKEATMDLWLNREMVDPEAAKEAFDGLAASRGFSYRDRYDRRFVRIPAGALHLARQMGGDYRGGVKFVQIEQLEGVPD